MPSWSVSAWRATDRHRPGKGAFLRPERAILETPEGGAMKPLLTYDAGFGRQIQRPAMTTFFCMALCLYRIILYRKTRLM
jgi:hypothetical protein